MSLFRVEDELKYVQHETMWRKDKLSSNVGWLFRSITKWSRKNCWEFEESVARESHALLPACPVSPM